MRNFFIVLMLMVFISFPVFSEETNYSPELVKKDIRFLPDSENKTLIAETEYKTIMNVGFDSIVNILSNFEGASKLFPNIVESRLVSDDNNKINRKIKASYKVMGLGISYSYIERINILKETDEEFTVESELVKSLDKRINNYRGIWHISRLPATADGKDQSMVSLYSYFNYNKPFFLQDVILDTFTDNEVAEMFACVKNAALQR